jgi:transcriptional regulator with XRE-family HTH domain
MTERTFQLSTIKNLNNEILCSNKSLSAIAREAEIDPSLLSKYKREENIPSLKILMNLCLVLELDLDDINDVEMCGIIE